MPVTLSYLVLCWLALVGALLLGLVSHWVHSEFQPFPDKLFDGGGTSDLVLNELMSPEHRVFGHYDEAGWWEFNSWRNYAMHAAPYVLAVVVVGLLNWEHRAEAVTTVCSGAASIGLTPNLCP